MDKNRRYRNWVEDRDLVSFQVAVEESDLFIRADKALIQEARDSLKYYRKLIQDYTHGHPEFTTSLLPYHVEEESADIIQDMAKAAFSANVGPMAAVAGAIAEYVGRDLLKQTSEVIVENGGDIFMKTNRSRRVGIFAGKSSYTGKLALEIAPGEESWGICTSSGTVGHSLSFGQADAAIAICQSATLADAWATRLGNMVKTEDDVDRTLEFVKHKPKIKGVVIIIGEKLGVWGEVKLINC